MGISAFDLFCGCGGVTYGLRKAGIRVAVGVDINPDCRMTYKLNNPGTKFIVSDLRHISAKNLLDAAGGISTTDYVMLAACAPCQPFSSQRRTKASESERTILGQVCRLVRELRPDFLFLENVPGMRRVSGFSSFRRLVHTLFQLSYKIVHDVIDAQSYGVPQSRKRLVLLASRRLRICWPNVTHGNEQGLLPYRTVRDAISGYPPLAAGEVHATIPNHVAAKISACNISRLHATPQDGGSRTDWPSELVLKCHREYDGHTDVYGRLKWDAPAPTLTTKCTSISNGRYGHPEQDRAISVREAAALQGFSDDYVFYGNLREITTQVGNSVPPTIAEKFGRAFVKASESAGKPRRGTKSKVRS